MNNNTILSYPPIICASHEPAESIRSFDSSSYHNYPSHSMAYAEYPLSTSKSETIEYTCWPTTIPTHNILSNSSNTVLDQVSPPLSSNPTLDTLGSVSSVHLLPNTLPVQHHQHLYPQPSTSPPSTWIGSGDYQALHSTAITTPPSYRHYSTPCSYYHPQYFYDQPPSQWVSSTSVKFEPSYTPPPSYIESSESLSHCREQTSKEEPGESRQQSTWPKKETSPTHFTLVPPRNPLNGKTRTRDKYRIVYTDQQRYELENEFIMSKYISIPRKSALSLTLSLSERQIKIWFQNRRAKERKLNKKRHGPSSSNQLNNSNDADSRSDGGLESPNCYPNYT